MFSATSKSHLPLSYIDSHSKGDILSKMMNDIDNISNTLQNNLIQIITSAVSFIGMLALMFYVSWQLTLITLSVLPPSLLVISIISKRSKRYFRRQWDETGNINGHIEEMYTGHTLIKVGGVGDYVALVVAALILDALGIHPLAVGPVGGKGQGLAVPNGPLGHAGAPLLGVPLGGV